MICDFKDIEKAKITQDDFIYLDPPYLLGLASYNELGGWTESKRYLKVSFINQGILHTKMNAWHIWQMIVYRFYRGRPRKNYLKLPVKYITM